MFTQSPDERLSAWKQFRENLETSNDPLLEVIHFWQAAPFLPYNKNIDPFNSKSWPTPWEIIVENKYDDFTKAVMIGWTLKYTNKFAKSNIQVRTLVDNAQNIAYNVVSLDDIWILNYEEERPVLVTSIPDSFRLENIVVLEVPK